MSGGGSKTQTVGYRYYFGLHMGIGRGPVDALHEIRIGEREAWKGEVTGNATIEIDKYDLFGGEEKEGGVKGPLELMFGGSNQEASSGLKKMLGNVIPGFRGVFTAFFNGLICMNNPYPKPWKFRLNRTLKGWDGPVFLPDYARVPLNDPSEFFPATINGVSVGTFGEYKAAWAAANPGYSLRVVGEIVRVGGSPTYTKAMAEKYGLAWTQFEPGFTTVLLSYYPNLSGVEFSKWDEGLLNNDQMMQQLAAPVGVNNLFNVRWWGQYLAPAVMVQHGSPPPPTPPDFYWNLGGNANTSTSIGSLDVYEGNYIRLRMEGTLDANPEYPAYSMNAAHIIYECLTNRVWGRGLPSTKLDIPSFTAAAQTLWIEKFGLCLKWTRKDEIATFVQSILDHIGGALYVSRKTGLLTLKLIRADYDFNSLPLFDTESGLLEISELSVSSVGGSVNAVFVKYRDWRTDEEKSVGEKNAAAIAAAGGVVNSVTKSYPGIPTADLALRVALRDLRSSSTSLRKFKLLMDRRAEDIEPGDVIAIQDPKRGIQKMAVRVGAVEDGTIKDGRITITVAQDVFSLPATPITAEVPSTWVPPDNTPCMAEQQVMEVPYFILASTMSKADLDYMSPDGGYIGALSAQGKATNQGFQVALRSGAPTSDDNPPDNRYVCGI